MTFLLLIIAKNPISQLEGTTYLTNCEGLIIGGIFYRQPLLKWKTPMEDY